MKKIIALVYCFFNLICFAKSSLDSVLFFSIFRTKLSLIKNPTVNTNKPPITSVLKFFLKILRQLSKTSNNKTFFLLKPTETIEKSPLGVSVPGKISLLLVVVLDD